MAFSFKKFWKGINIVPKTSSTADEKGDLEVLSSNGKLNYHNGTNASPIVTEVHVAELENKTIDADKNTISNLEVDNLKAGVLNTDPALIGATDTQIPSALAVKTHVDSIDTNVSDLVTLTGVPANSTDLGTFTGISIPDNSTIKQALQALETVGEMTEFNLTSHIANPTGAHAASAISVIPTGNLLADNTQDGLEELQDDIDTINGILPTKVNKALSSTDNAIVRFDGITGDTVQNSVATLSDSGALAGLTNLTVDNLNLDGNTITGGTSTLELGTNIVETTSTKILNGAVVNIPFVDSTTTGSNVIVNINKYKNITLTNASLTSIDGLLGLASISGQEVSLTNLTGNDITINNETGIAPSSQISTGTGSPVVLKNKQTFSFLYNTVENKWTIIGGTGSGTGGGTTDVDVLAVDTYDSSVVGDYTQTGLTFNTVTPIHGVQSAQLVHQAATSQFYKKTLPVDRKFRGQLVELSLSVRSTASDGNVTLLVTDETNSATIAASQPIQTDSFSVSSLTITSGISVIGGFNNVDINKLAVGMAVSGTGIQNNTVIVSINTSTNSVIISQTATSTTTTALRFSAIPTTRTFSFKVPDSCESLSYTITALQESGSPRTTIDDVVLKLAQVSLLETSVEVPVITDWVSYTPSISGLGSGSVASILGKYRRVGDSAEISVRFQKDTTAGTGAASVTVTLPSGLTLDASKFTATAGSHIGTLFSNAATPSQSNLTSYVEQTSNAIRFTTAAGDVTGSTVAASTVWDATLTVPILGWSATETISIPLTQSGLKQEADSMVRLSGANGFGSTATTTRRFASVVSSVGTDIAYIDSATLGGQFVAQSAGIYNVSYSESSLSNAVDTSTIIDINGNSVAFDNQVYNTASTARKYSSTSWSGYLNKGDIITAKANPSANDGNLSNITITKAGSLKQVTVNENSKIKIPTSELRFEGASSRGSVATTIIKFDTIAKIRGDAFTITSDASNGTAITMTKAGVLSVSSSVFFGVANAYIYLSKNQQNLTITPVASEFLSCNGVTTSTGTGSPVCSANWTGTVAVGDVIRISSLLSPVSNAANNLNLSFQEQEIQVSVSNTLPQFSESDSCVRLSGGNGFGSTATTTRRFSSVVQNIGNDIQYTDSATLGGRFVAQSAGVYNISYSEASLANTSSMSVFLAINGVGVAGDNQTYNTASTTIKRASVSWQGYLNKDDVVTALVASAGENDGNTVFFTISKVGKPNVTGVDVTPFVNVPQPLSQSSFKANAGSFGVATITGALSTNTNTGVYSYNETTGIYTALKPLRLNASFSLSANAASNVTAVIVIDGSDRAVSVSLAQTNAWASTSYSGELQPGQTFSFRNAVNTANSLLISVTATALSDQILTVPETFSTDTAPLTYASSSQYTLATLANAPIGTYITFAYAANTNTRTQTTGSGVGNLRPTQTDADMQANGIRIYTRAYNAASTGELPAAIAIQIGKGMKGITTDLYKSVGKVISGSTDYYFNGSTYSDGIRSISYNEVTGILYVDTTLSISSTITTHTFVFSDVSTQNNGYLVINASKNPALTGMNVNRVAARAVQSSGQVIPNTGATTIITWDAAKTYDTNGALNTSTGIFTAPETGYYQVSARIAANSSAWTVGPYISLNIFKNGVVQSLLSAFVSQASVTIAVYLQGSDIVYLSKGDTMYITSDTNRTGGAVTLSTSSSQNYFSICKVGN